MKLDTVGFIGGGNMTQAIAGGLLDNGFDPKLLSIAEPHKPQRDKLAESLQHVFVTADNSAVVARSSCLVLAVKPQILARVCQDLAASVQTVKPLIISIAAGPRIADIDTWLGGNNAIVRVMPNQPALLGKGVSGIFGNALTSDAQLSAAKQILSAVGPVIAVHSESDIDAVTAVSGSGPAYFYLLIDMIAKTGVELLGAATLAKSSGDTMDELIARVRSPGGTTAAALDSLEDSGIRDIFITALTAARDRATELADQAHQNTQD
jgi:pyrroline-5-carboxylate reductase